MGSRRDAALKAWETIRRRKGRAALKPSDAPRLVQETFDAWWQSRGQGQPESVRELCRLAFCEACQLKTDVSESIHVTTIKRVLADLVLDIKRLPAFDCDSVAEAMQDSEALHDAEAIL